MPDSVSKTAPVPVLFLIALLFVLIASSMPDVFWSTDEGNKFIQVQNFARSGNIFLDYPGKDIDPDYRFFPYAGNHFIRVKGKVYSYHPFYFPFVSHYFFRLFGDYGIYFLPVLGTLITIWFLLRLLQRFEISSKLILIGLFTIVFCTPLFYYSITFWELSVSLALWLGALLLLMHVKEKGTAFWAGVLTGLTTVFREEGYILFIAVMISMVVVYREARRPATFAAGWGLVLLPIWVINTQLFSNFLGLHANFYNPAGYGIGAVLRPEMISTFLSNLYVYLGEFHSDATKAAIIAVPLFVVAGSGLLISSTTDSWRLAGVIIATLIAAFAVFELVTSASPVYNVVYTQGLLPAIPWLLVPLLWSRTYLFSKSREYRFLLLMSFLFVVGMCLTLNQKHFGLLWGPRQFFPLYPVFLLLAMDLLRSVDYKRAAFLTCFAVLLSLSLIIQVHGIYVLHVKRDADLRIVEALEKASEQVIVTDVFWMPESLSSLFFQKRIFMVNSDEQLRSLLQLFKQKQISEFIFIAGRNYRKISQEGAAELLKRTVQRERFVSKGMEFAEVMLLHCR